MAESAALTWQEQFDLGVRYLGEENYEEAIIAFQAAITIDPKRPESYAKLADVYVARKDTDAALAILQQGYEATGDASLQEYRTTLELKKNPWPALTAEQQAMFRALADATRSFDRAAVSEIMQSEAYYYFYEEFPYTRHNRYDYGDNGGFDMTTDDGETYVFSYWRNEENDELQFSFYIYEEEEYYEVLVIYKGDSTSHFEIGRWRGEIKNENGPFKHLSWIESPNYDSAYRVTEGTALNGIRVGTETRTEYRSNGESAYYVVEFDQEGNLIYDSAQLEKREVDDTTWVKYTLSDGTTDMVYAERGSWSAGIVW